GPALNPNAVSAPESAIRNGTRMFTLNTAYPPSSEATLVSSTGRDVSTCRSIRGSVVRNSRTTHPAAAATVTANIASTNGAAQPCCGPSVSATINAAMAAPSSAAPGVSNDVWLRGPPPGTVTRTSTAARINTTTPTPNTHRQLVNCVIRPPRPNPANPPTPNPPVSPPMPLRTR